MFPRTTAASADESDEEFGAVWFWATGGGATKGGLTTDVERWDMISQVTAAPTAAENTMGNK
jgi:hypothetical protein